jgi:hypothetical protein
MRLSIKLTFVLFFLLLASSLLVLTPSCSGKSSGGCPNDTAPNGATIVAPTITGIPTNAGGNCYPILPFTIKDVNGIPMNGICVEVYSNGFIAPSTGAPSCNDAQVNQQFGFVTRTDNSGNILVELLTLPTATGGIFTVTVDSGGLSGVASTPPTVD